MKLRWIAILLIFLVCFESIGIKEIIKIPILIHHYFEHKNKCASENLLSYLNNHYKLPQKYHSEHDKKTDKKLPYKSTDKQQSNLSSYICTGHKIHPIVFGVYSKVFTTLNESCIISLSFSIWQPPKIA